MRNGPDRAGDGADTDGEACADHPRHGHHIPLGLSSVPAERALTPPPHPQPCLRGRLAFVGHKVRDGAVLLQRETVQMVFSLFVGPVQQLNTVHTRLPST